MSSIARVVGNSVLYALSSVLQRASSILFFPIFTLYLTSRDYGILSLTQSVFGFVSLLGGLELGRSVTRFLSEDERPEHRRRLLGTALVTTVTLGALLAGLLHLAGGVLLRPVLADIPFYPYMAWTVYALPLLGAYTLYTTYLRGIQDGRRFLVVDLSFFASNVALNLLFVVGLGLGALGIVLSTFVSAALFVAALCPGVFLRLELRTDLALLRRMLAFSLPLVPFTFAGMWTDAADRVALNHHAGAQASGVYYIALTLGSFFSVLKESVFTSLMPWYFEQADRTPPDQLRRILVVLYAGVGVLSLGPAWFGRELLMLLSRRPELIEGWRYAPLIVDAYLIVFLGQLISLPIYHDKRRVRLLAGSTVLAGLVNVGACAVLVPRFAAYGAGAGKVLAYAAMTAYIAALGRGVGLRMPVLQLSAITLLIAALSLVAYLPLELAPLLAVKVTGFVVLFGGFGWYVDQRFALRSYIRGRLAALRRRPTSGGAP